VIPRELNRDALADFPLPPLRDTDKDEHGRLLVIAGSRTVPGAAILSASAALRSGTGKLKIATASSVAPGLALTIPEALVLPLEEAQDGGFAATCVEELGQQARKVDAIVAGPGMKSSEAGAPIAALLLSTGKPIALDAALLHCLAPLSGKCRDAKSPPVLLPHSGEMASLLECEESEVERDGAAAAEKAAERYGACVLAKGSTSFIAGPDRQLWIWKGGTPGLGIGGSGDVLAGIVGAQLARGADPMTALLWSVLLHGEAGKALANRVGPMGFLARELPDEIPALLPV
jgi:hydroxyethylthiazole kinase-like uncharacterized protein yjeF